MRGDQLARWRMIRAVEANSNGVTETERAEQRETAPRTIYLDLGTLQGEGFPLYTERVERANRWPLIHSLKFKLPAPFTSCGERSYLPKRHLGRLIQFHLRQLRQHVERT